MLSCWFHHLPISSSLCHSLLLWFPPSFFSRLHVFIPFAAEDFIHGSVDYQSPEYAQWVDRFNLVLKRSASHFVTNERFLNDHGLYDFAYANMKGLASLRAMQTNSDLVCLAALDCRLEKSRGPIADFVHESVKSGQMTMVRKSPQC